MIAAAPVTDTVKRAADRRDYGEQGARAASSTGTAPDAGLSVERTVDRGRLWAAQTPQVFRTAALREALAVDAGRRDAATDEAMLVEEAGGTVLLHPSGPENLKVTTPHDLRLAELLLADRAGAEPASVGHQQPDQHRDEGQLADAEGDAEADRAEQPGERRAGGEGEQQEE